MHRSLLACLGAALVLASAAPSARGQAEADAETDADAEFEAVRKAFATDDINLALDLSEAGVLAHPDDGQWWLARGIALSLSLDPKATEALMKAIELDPTLAVAHLLLAESAIEVGNWDAARSRLERAEALEADVETYELVADELARAERIANKTKPTAIAGSARAAVLAMVSRVESGESLAAVVHDSFDRSVLATALTTVLDDVSKQSVNSFIAAVAVGFSKRNEHLGIELGAERVVANRTWVPLVLWVRRTYSKERLEQMRVVAKGPDGPPGDVNRLAATLSDERWAELVSRLQRTPITLELTIELACERVYGVWRVFDAKIDGLAVGQWLVRFKKARPELEKRGLLEPPDEDDAVKETTGYKIGQAVGRMLPIAVIVGLFVWYRRRAKS